MQTHRLSAWDIGYVILLVLSIPILVDDAVKGLWGQVALTVIFLIGGLVAVAYSWRRSEALGPRFAYVRETRPHQGRQHRGLERTETGRPFDWLAMAVTSGFIATGVLTSILLVAYGGASVLGSNAPGASLFSHWLWSLTHNPATNAARVNLPLALVVNFAAGIVWAIVYAAVFEPRLRGSGWERGLLFALLPWLISILVEPQLGENIGAAARAMMNFGLSEMRLVNPRGAWPNKKAVEMSSGAESVIVPALASSAISTLRPLKS